ncbi:phosphomannomutase/phosphoglucomutase [Lysobacter sp. GX 14042]|nr:phosphomannomutase/phosphoglucomutase [Lysobacter sp. GX 14042]MCE7032226.1 phosphomannomutase/phosphoglucomutase [Lysobacter sp. GX 14042]
MRLLLAALAALLVLLAAWFAWSAWQQHLDGERRSGVTRARDEAVAGISAALGGQQQRMAERVGSAPVQQAAADGDFPRAADLLDDDWTGVVDGVLMPAELDAAYQALPDGGYGRLGAMEAALAADAPVAWVVRAGDAERMAIAAPVRGEQGRLLAVALVHLPLEVVTAPVSSAAIPDGTYLALRQGGHSVLERGDNRLSGSAEALGTRVPGSGLRVSAAVPYVAPAPLGLSAPGATLGALVLLGLALLVLLAPRLVARVRAHAHATDIEDTADSPTLAEAAAQPEDDEIDTDTPSAGPSDSATPAPVVPDVQVDPGIFRAYDIRGIVGRTLSPEVASLVGQAIGTVMQEKGLTDIVVGRDGRLSGSMLSAALIEGLRKAGRNVVDIGMAPTPLVYFGAYHLRAGSCVSVTGSHNPPDYNGFKVVVGGDTLSGDAVTDLYARIAGGHLYEAPAEGGLEQRDIEDDYVQRVATDIQLERPLKVVVDAGNGVAGGLGPKVLEAIGAEVVPLYCDIDGSFPNHHPDPSEPQNLADLVQMVGRLEADLGVAFDGDGDRLGVVTRDGHNIYPDRLLMLFAADVLERNPGAQIIFDVKCTGRLPGYVLRHGGSPLMWKTGHSLIKSKMRETGAELAGEMSGHFFFQERWYGFDDGIYAAARLLEILAARAESAGEVLEALPEGVSTPEIKVPAPGEDPHSFVERFVAEADFSGARLSTIDGLRVDWPDGWGLVRASNTTPVLVLRFDADDQAALERIQDEFRRRLLALEPDLPLGF